MKTKTASERRERRRAERLLHGARMRLAYHHGGTWIMTAAELARCQREIRDLEERLGLTEAIDAHEGDPRCRCTDGLGAYRFSTEYCR